jgi:hypothetical protein
VKQGRLTDERRKYLDCFDVKTAFVSKKNSSEELL